MLTRALCVDAVRSALSRDACAAPADLELEVRREHAFSLVLPDAEGEEQLWSGMIDRLVVGRRKGLVVYAEIADYKTDAIAEADVAGRVAHYRPQLEAYGRVVAAQTGLAPEDVRLRLIFLGPARVVDL
jgi:ATP-dependent exoDNAse (exonuclease V) beta subunit